MKSLSRQALAIKPSATLAVDSKAKALRAQGFNVLNFGIGEPDFDTPEHIRQAGIDAIRDGWTRYTPAAGLPELRRAVADRLKADTGAEYEPSQIVVASGAKHVLFIALQTLLDPGDEVILPAPYWVSYYEMIRMAGGVPVIVHAPEEQDFKMTPAQLDAAVTEKTKAVMINSPSNPAGSVYSEAEMRALAELCRVRDLYIISDEIYNNLVYDGLRCFSIAACGEDARARSILVNGVSKSYAMTGWRIGYAAAPANIAKAMSSYLSHSTGAPGTMCQLAAVAALNGSQDTVEQMCQAFDVRRRFLVERINAIDGVSCIMPQGAFYVMVNLSQLMGRTIGGVLIDSDSAFAEAFLEQSLVALTPCVGFGMPDFVRWSYAAGLEQLREGADRLESFLRKS